jgi:ABC-type nickel/cobalt efflux system permease component RcnA
VADEQQPAPKKRTDPPSQLARGELVHAEVKPLDLSGIPSVITGIVAWAVAFVVVLIFRDELKKDGLDWWLWVTVAGVGLGLIGLWYCRRRWAAIQAGHRSEHED